MGGGFNKKTLGQYLWKLRVLFNIPRSHMLCDRFNKWSPCDPLFDNPPIILLDSSLNNCDFSLDTDLSLRSSSSLHNSYLESCFQTDIHVITSLIPPPIPYTVSMNTPKTIQIPSSLVHSSLVSYVVLLVLYGFVMSQILHWVTVA